MKLNRLGTNPSYRYEQKIQEAAKKNEWNKNAA